MRWFLTRMGTALGATVLALLLVEGLMRVGLFGDAGRIPDLVTREDTRAANWHQAGKPFVWRGRIGRPREFEVHSRWNSLAQNDADYPFEKAPDVRRIVVLGDSYVEAVQVEQARSFHNLLEANLARSLPPGTRYEVVALGMSGSGPRMSLEKLRRVGLRFEPDIVLLEFLGFNDVSDDSEALAIAFALQQKRLRQVSSRVYLPELWTGESPWAQRLGLANWRVAVFLGQSWNNLEYRRRVSMLDRIDRIPHHWFAFLADYDPDVPYEKAWIDGWEATAGYIREIQAECERAGAKLLLIRFTDRWRAAPGGLRELYTAYPAMLAMGMDFERDRVVLEGLAAEEGIPYLDLFPAFRAAWTDDRPLHFAADTHWNEAGHEVAEAEIRRRLLELGWLR